MWDPQPLPLDMANLSSGTLTNSSSFWCSGSHFVLTKPVTLLGRGLHPTGALYLSRGHLCPMRTSRLGGAKLLSRGTLNPSLRTWLTSLVAPSLIV